MCFVVHVSLKILAVDDENDNADENHADVGENAQVVRCLPDSVIGHGCIVCERGAGS